MNDIAVRWEDDVRRTIPELARVPRQALVDHLPEFVNGLAAWLEGDRGEADRSFRMLAEGHALTRQTAGVELATLTAEYGAMRRAILEQLDQLPHSPGMVRARVELNAGIDLAIQQAVLRYSHAREEARERFISILAHDLRDPLAAITMSATLLRTGTLDARQVGILARIERGAARIERMVQDVLDFARGRLGSGIPVVPAEADMAAICTAAADEVSAGRRVHVQLDVTGDLRGVWDAERVKQALANLLANAFHHGGGDVALRAWEHDDRRFVFTAVTNHGPVIPAEMLSRLFDPFAGAGGGTGLGLGLFIVQQIALAHGGSCRVTSSAEEGTTFTIAWPRVPIEDTPMRRGDPPAATADVTG